MKSRTALACASAALALATACPPTTPPPDQKAKEGEQCARRDDCEDGLVCFLGLCAQPPDAAVAPDAGQRPDAGNRPDAAVGLDAARVDARVPLDAGRPDAARLDAGGTLDATAVTDAAPPGDARIARDRVRPPRDVGPMDIIFSPDATNTFECLDNEDCQLGEMCNTTTHLCVIAPCASRKDCGDSGYICGFSGLCEWGCRTDNDCAYTDEVCDPATGRCAVPGASRCARDLDCNTEGTNTMHCDVSTGICIMGRRCAWDRNCERTQRCGPDGTCVTLIPCDSQLECPNNMYCDPGKRICMEKGIYCRASGDCTEAQRCDLTSSRCVTGGSCLDDTFCRLDLGEVCHPVDHYCLFPTVPCSADRSCRPDERCHPLLYRCVPRKVCQTPGECPPGKTCEIGSGNCVTPSTESPCTDNSQCAPQQVCSMSGVCVAVPFGVCNSNADCLSNEVCVVERGECAQRQDTPPCTGDSDCPQGQRCIGPATGSGVCQPIAQCINNASCLPGEVCDAVTGQCFRPVDGGGAASCSVDENCALNEYCDTGTGTCFLRAGGTPCVGVDAGVCRDGEECDRGTGLCVPVTTQDTCTVDQDCDPTEVCDSLTRRCILRAGGQSCTVDSDCRNGEICTAENICQVIEINGPCESDVDCLSSQLCDPATQSCVTPNLVCQANRDCIGGQCCRLDINRCVNSGGPCAASVDCFCGQICNTAIGVCQFAI
jgi:hypothetical protein